MHVCWLSMYLCAGQAVCGDASVAPMDLVSCNKFVCAAVCLAVCLAVCATVCVSHTESNYTNNNARVRIQL